MEGRTENSLKNPFPRCWPTLRGAREGVTLEAGKLQSSSEACVHLPFTAGLRRMTDSIKEVVPNRQVGSPRSMVWDFWHPAFCSVPTNGHS